MTEKFANNASSTLNGAINNSVTTLVVTSATSFPSSPNFRLILGTDANTAEIVLVTGVSGTTFTVVRGQEGTSASSWNDGTTVTHVLTAGGLNQALTAGGDLSGTVENATVIKINGTTVPSTPSTNQVLVASSGTSSIWSQIYDGYVASAAAIAGTKINPNFGSQNITTTGSVSTADLTSTSINTSLLNISGKQIFTGLNSAPAVSNAGEGNIYFDSSVGKFKLSENGGAYGSLAVDGYFGSTNITTTGSISSGSITSTSLTTSQNILSGKLIVNGITTSVVSDSGQGVLYFDSSLNRFYISENAGSYVRLLTDGYSAGGDLTGTYSNPTVAKIRGNNISSQILGASQDGYVLLWNNTDGYWKANLNWYSIVENAGTPLTQRTNLNFTGGGVSVADSGGKTVVTIPNSAGGDLSGTLPSATVTKIQGNSVTAQTLNSTTDGYALTWSNSDGYWKATPNGITRIQDEGSNLAQRSTVDFVGAGVTATDTGSKTQVSIPGYNNTIENNGSALTQRNTINFVGAGFGISDLNNKTTINIPGISGSGYTWKTVYQVDFSTLSTQSFSGNGSVTIDGYTWTVANFSAATSFGIVNGEGLKFTCNTTNTDYNNSTRSALLITVPIKTLFPTFDLFANKVRVSLYSTSNADQNAEYLVFGLEDANTPMSLSYAIFKGYETGTKITTKQTIGNTSTATVDATNTSHDIGQVTFHYPFQAELMSATYSSGFPSQETYTPRRVYLNSNFTPSLSNSNDINLVISAITNNTNGNFIATAKALKIEIFNSDVAVTLDGYSNLPAAGVPGRLFMPTGGNHFLIDATSTWKAFGPIYPLKLPPSVSSLTWVNQGTKSVAQNNLNGTGFSIVAFPNGSNSRHLLVQTAPTAPYTFTVMVNISLWPNVTTIGGIVFYENGTGKGIEHILYYNSNELSITNTKFTSTSGTFTSYSDGYCTPVINTSQIWLRQRDDGTNLTWSWSLDGVNFMRWDAPRARADFFTTAPDRIGVIVDNPGSVTAGNTTTITYTVTNATNATPIQITTSSAHSLQTGEVVSISGVGGNTAANSIFFITVVDTTNFTLNGSVGNGAYTSGGTVTFEPICSKMNVLHWEVTSG